MCKSDEICAGVSFIIGSYPHLHIAVISFLRTNEPFLTRKKLFLIVESFLILLIVKRLVTTKRK